MTDRRPASEPGYGFLFVGAKKTRGMREYWDERARLNAVWYVDTSVDFANPDMAEFLRTGEKIVTDMLDQDPPALPSGRELAVEIGSGLGRICLALSRRFDSVIGIDVSPEMVQRSRELVNDPRVRFEVGDGTTISPVAAGSADLVVSFTVFQHIPDPAMIEAYVSEAGRVLRRGGAFIFQWDSRESPWSWKLGRAARILLQRSGIRREPFGRDAAEFLGSRVSRDRMARAVTSAGMDLVGTRGDPSLFTFGWALKR